VISRKRCSTHRPVLWKKAIESIRQIQSNAGAKNDTTRARWPMIVLRSPKGWTGRKSSMVYQSEGTFRAHQVPLSDPATHPEHLKCWKTGCGATAGELFDEQGQPETGSWPNWRPRANGAWRQSARQRRHVLRDLRMPDFRDYASTCSRRGRVGLATCMCFRAFPPDVAKLNNEQRNSGSLVPTRPLSNAWSPL